METFDYDCSELQLLQIKIGIVLASVSSRTALRIMSTRITLYVGRLFAIRLHYERPVAYAKEIVPTLAVVNQVQESKGWSSPSRSSILLTDV